MRTPRPTRSALGALLLAALLALAAGCGSDQDPAVSGPTSSTTSTADGEGDGGSTTTTPGSTTSAPDDGVQVIEVTVTGGQPEGGARTESVDVGDEVELRVTADAADEVHVHGYELVLELHPDETATLRFTADLPGRWEVELHEAEVELLQLEVRG